MADFLKNIIGGDKAAESPAPSADSDFADFAGAASPSPVSFGDAPDNAAPAGAAPTIQPWTAWYNVHERHSISEFKAEGIILACIVVIFTLHYIGTTLNRSKSKAWIKAHAPVLTSEFTRVGFLDKNPEQLSPEQLIKEKSLFEYASYATGRQNVAFMDLKISLKKRFNPFMTAIETTLGFFLDSFTTPDDSVEAVIYPFDGKEDKIVPSMPGAAELRSKDLKSSYDGFVWALVNKDNMKQLRDDRYDVSITFTKDHAKLPNWATVMSENAEVTNTLLTDELVSAIKQAGDLFEYLIVSDQPLEKPRTLEETIPRKRLYLRYRLPSSNSYENLVPLLSYFIRLSDQLATSAHFRAEVQRKLKHVREDLIKHLHKQLEEEKAEERALERDKVKKAKRDAELNALDAKAQKRYLEKEKEKEMRKSAKKSTVRA